MKGQKAGTITSSPDVISNDCKAICNALVPELTPTEYFELLY